MADALCETYRASERSTEIGFRTSRRNALTQSRALSQVIELSSKNRQPHSYLERPVGHQSTPSVRR